MVPVVGGGGVHAIVNVAAAVSPAVIAAVCEFPPATVQVDGTSRSVTVWLPALSPRNVTVAEAPIGLVVPPPPLTATVYPDVGGLAGVLVVTVRVPAGGGGAMMSKGALVGCVRAAALAF